IGFHAQPVQAAILREEKPVESSVVLEPGKQAGRHQRLLMNEHDVRRLRRQSASGPARKIWEWRPRRGLYQLSTHQRAPRLAPRREKCGNKGFVLGEESNRTTPPVGWRLKCPRRRNRSDQGQARSQTRESCRIEAPSQYRRDCRDYESCKSCDHVAAIITPQ